MSSRILLVEDNADLAEGIEYNLRLEGYDVRVADNGRGFDPAQVPSGRLGVRVSIIELVTNLGGDARVESAPGKGTTVVIRWPSAEVVAASELVGSIEQSESVS